MFSYGFPGVFWGFSRVFLVFSYGFPMVFLGFSRVFLGLLGGRAVGAAGGGNPQLEVVSLVACSGFQKAVV